MPILLNLNTAVLTTYTHVHTPTDRQACRQTDTVRKPNKQRLEHSTLSLSNAYHMTATVPAVFEPEGVAYISQVRQIYRRSSVNCRTLGGVPGLQFKSTPKRFTNLYR